MKAFHENRMYGASLPIQVGPIRDISFLAHWHNDIELMYVREGMIRMGVNSETRILRQGDIAVCGSGDIHFYDSREHHSEILLLIFPPQLIGSPGGWPREVRLASPFILRSGDRNGELDAGLAGMLSDRMETIREEADLKKPRYEMLVTGLLYELSGLVLRHVDCIPADQQRDKRRIVGMKLMQEVFDWLESGFQYPVTLEDAAKQANLSIFHFSRYFKSIAGMSFLTYLNHLRARKAEELILSTDMTMLDIALECGFTNVRTFNRVFRQVMNRTPSSLR